VKKIYSVYTREEIPQRSLFIFCKETHQSLSQLSFETQVESTATRGSSLLRSVAPSREWKCNSLAIHTTQSPDFRRFSRSTQHSNISDVGP